MLSQIQQLTLETEGRYATDEELNFFVEYVQSYELRAQTYQKLQAIETTVSQQVESKVRSLDPNFFIRGTEDVTNKCRRDISFVFRYSAAAMLINDPELLREQLLFWFQTIVSAFSLQKNHSVTYSVMPEVIKQHLTPAQADLFLPILEMNRRMLGRL